MPRLGGKKERSIGIRQQDRMVIPTNKYTKKFCILLYAICSVCTVLNILIHPNILFNTIHISKAKAYALLQTVEEQESLAIAKTTARCAQYMGALKSFESPRKRPRLLFPKFLIGFCSYGPSEYICQI